MRILMLTPAYPPLPGGGERYVRALALRLARRGHTVTVLTSDVQGEADLWRRRTTRPAPNEADDGGVRVIRCAAAGFPGGRAALLAWRKAMVLLSALPGDQSALLMHMARRVPTIPDLETTLGSLAGPYDLVHSFNLSWEHALVAAWRYAQKERLPLVVTPFAHFGVGARDRVALNTSMDHQRRILRDAAAVLALTSVERERLLAFGLRAERVAIVGAGLDPLPASPVGLVEELRRRHRLETPLITFVGRLSRDKGAIHAAEAVRALRARGTPVTLALVGQTSPEFARYYRTLDQAGQRAIRPLGILDEAAKHALLETSAMLVLPSRVDSFGIVLLEAWAHGLPVLGARASGIPGVIAAGEDGLLVDYGDVAGLAGAMRHMIQEPALARSMGARGQQKVAAQYTWDIVCERVIEVYRQVVA